MRKYLLSLILLGTSVGGFAATQADSIDPDMAALQSLGLTQPAARFVATLENTVVGAKITGLPAIDFTSDAATTVTTAAYKPAMDALVCVPGFSVLKSGNVAYAALSLKNMLIAKDDITTAIAESAIAGALTAASGTLAADIALIPQADARVAPAKILANLFERAYNTSGVTTPSVAAATWLGTVALPAAVKAELEKDSTWTAILAAIA